ncbi:holo-ACP synthase [Pseudomethylobacillus aquaticus]|uniref:Holo-[acyl-carrier-protein] synthase n=1 Tax=Pseudomethylobacillus aquaticus TaxID=2676064 RepID=A0A3N0V7C9_9PROT|nr:holo-ACP synthase [Pseudomethylobacillus aquaticus]ROH88504.1 holo-ACP synthase [Pseudomethylobacillus aquaticus]
MIYGIGTDIVAVARIEASLERFGETFARRVLTAQEFPVWQQSPQQARFLAKRFAVKEAFAKALGTGLRAPALMPNIGVQHDDLGKPGLILSADLQHWVNQQGIAHTHLTISDEHSMVVAFVVLERA